MVEASKGSTSVNKFFQPITQVKSDKSPSMKAELRWLLHSAELSKSFASEDKAANLFRAMFPDSNIAKHFSCGRTKQVYLLNFALAPYFRQKIVDALNNSFYSVSFDEADGLMMIMVRYLSEDGDIRTEMLDLVPLNGDFSAANCATIILGAVDKAGLSRKNWISDMSDKCNTMRGVLTISTYCFNTNF